MNKIIPIEYDRYYHIFNRGINSTTLFKKPEDYAYFSRKYQKYISPVAETYAWCLMKNHFHFLVKIREEGEIEYLPPKSTNSTLPGPPDPERLEKRKKPNPTRQFSHLFNAYTKWFNKKYKRTGSLFERSFKRVLIDSKNYFKQLVYYIHHNPMHHGISNDFSEFSWSSYATLIGNRQTAQIITLGDTTEWFGGIESFIEYHGQEQDTDKLKKVIIE